MRLIGNIFLFILGGIWTGLSWWIVGVLFYVSILGIPWAKACFVIGQFSLFPFGKTTINRRDLYQKDDIGTGDLAAIGNIIWVVFAGIWLAIGHVAWGLICCITLIFIPFGIQHFKLARLSLFPIGQQVVPIEVAVAVQKRSLR